MSTDIAPAAPAPTFLGQGTAIEQARAVAEVQAAIVVAQQCPRNMQGAIAQMEQSCRQKGLAERAFYRYNRGGGAITGASVHLARELARCFQNVQYGIAELRRDDVAGFSEMQAFAWDVQTNTRSSQIFIVPHKRDKKGGPEQLVDLRDIYENNSNNGARRLRQAIFSILPPWFVEDAKELCSRTLREGGGVPLDKRIANVIRAFDGIGVKLDQLEQKTGTPSAAWTEHDVAQLQVIGKSIERGEVTKADEFPPQRVTVDELGARPAEPAVPATPAGGWGPAPSPAAPTSAPPTPVDDSAQAPQPGTGNSWTQDQEEEWLRSQEPPADTPDSDR